MLISDADPDLFYKSRIRMERYESGSFGLFLKLFFLYFFYIRYRNQYTGSINIFFLSLNFRGIFPYQDTYYKSHVSATLVLIDGYLSAGDYWLWCDWCVATRRASVRQQYSQRGRMGMLPVASLRKSSFHPA